jgi:hypothetical protein
MRVHFLVKLFFSWIFLVFPNGSIMFFDIRRKIMRPIILGNEIKIWNRSGTAGSHKGVPARITDRSRGKSSPEIGVIRSGSQQIFFGQISIEISYSIDDGGIALEREVLFQTIVKYGRDERFLFRERCFFFDDGSQYHDFSFGDSQFGCPLAEV